MLHLTTLLALLLSSASALSSVEVTSPAEVHISRHAAFIEVAPTVFAQVAEHLNEDIQSGIDGSVVKSGWALSEMESSPTAKLSWVLIQTFAAIICGYYCKETGAINLKNGDTKAMDLFVAKVAFPLLVFRTVATADLGAIDLRVVLACTLGKVVAAASTWFITYFGYDRGESRGVGQRILTSTVFSFFTVASNDFALGFPVIVALYGEKSTMPVYIAANAFVNVILFQPLAMVLFEVGTSRKAEEEGSDKGGCVFKLMRTIFLNPVIVGTLLGVVYQLMLGSYHYWVTGGSDLSLPHPLSDLINLFTQPFNMLALFQTGLNLNTAKITFWPGLIVIMKVFVCAYASFLFSYYLMGCSDDWAVRSKNNFTFFYGMIPTSSAPLVFASEFDPSVAGIMSTGILFGLALAGPNLFLTSLFIAKSGAPGADTIAYVQRQTAHVSLFAGVVFTIFLVRTIKEWRDYSRFAIAAYGVLSLLYTVSMVWGPSDPQYCHAWTHSPWGMSRLIFSTLQNACSLTVLYMHYLLVTDFKILWTKTLAVLFVLGLSIAAALFIEPLTLNEVCGLQLGDQSLRSMCFGRGACVLVALALTLKGVVGKATGDSRSEGVVHEDPDSPRYGAVHRTHGDASAGFAKARGASFSDMMLHGASSQDMVEEESSKVDRARAPISTMRAVVGTQTLRFLIQLVNTSVVFRTAVAGSFTQMLIIENLLEHGQLIILGLAMLWDGSFRGLINQFFVEAGNLVCGGHISAPSVFEGFISKYP